MFRVWPGLLHPTGLLGGSKTESLGNYQGAALPSVHMYHHRL